MVMFIINIVCLIIGCYITLYCCSMVLSVVFGAFWLIGHVVSSVFMFAWNGLDTIYNKVRS